MTTPNGSRGSASRWDGVPVAWAAVGANGVPLWLAYHRRDAQGAVVGMAEVVPLYRSPTLTDEERDVLDRLAHDASNRRMEWTERVLRGVLRRLG